MLSRPNRDSIGLVCLTVGMRQGHSLLAAREAAFLTQDELGQLAGVHQSVISRIEHGRIRAHVSTRRKLADALGIPAVDLFPPTSHDAAMQTHRTAQPSTTP